MSTVYDLIRRTLKDAGITGLGQSPAPEDMNDAFDKLNSMIGQFNLRRWLIYQLLDVSCVSTGATTGYTVGPGCSFDTPRVDRLEGAFLRMTNGATPIDVHLDIIEAHEDWNRVQLKTLVSVPNSVFLDSGFPTGMVYFAPCPMATIYEMHLLVKAVIPRFTAITQTVVLPPEYEEALIYNLAIRLRPAYQMGPDPTVTQLAKAALNTIKNANTQMPRLQMPAGLGGHGGRFNIYSGF